jgi:DNA polymerase/3'-5' exonuclease PolX
MKTRFPLAEAKVITDELVAELKPYCTRIEHAGSIRRKKSTVGDIELLVIPKKINIGLFDEYPVLQAEPELVKIINKYAKVKGNIASGMYTQRVLPQGIALDLFTATEDTWGLQLAVRTGSSNFSFKTLACRWSKMGYYSREGLLRRKEDGIIIPLKEEIDLFNLLELDWVEPEERE